jgi:nicotinamide-nucleotide amidase
VYIAVSFAGLGGGTTVTELHITGDRERVRWWASQHALELVRQGLMERT